jgi:membrane protease subunit HflC
MKKLVLALIILAWLTTVFYTVDETEHAVVTRLEKIVATPDGPGLWMKLPWPIDRVTFIDSRRRAYLGNADEFITLDGHNILVAAYVIWRVDPEQTVQFMTSVPGLIPSAEHHLGFHLSGQLGSLLGETRLADLVREATAPVEDRTAGDAGAAIRNLSRQLKENLAAIAREDYGIEVIDARIRRLNFPDQNRETIYQRMRTAREELINRYRAQGEREAAAIESAAKREADIVRARAREEAEIIRGEGEAEAARLYNEAIERNPEFYDFVQRLETVRKSFKEGDTIVIPADWDLSRIIYEGMIEKPKQ